MQSCSFSTNGELLVTGAEDRTVRIWKMNTGECLHTLRGHTSSVIGCGISQDGRQIVSFEENQIVMRWSFTGNTWTLSYQFRSEGATNCGSIPNSNQLIFVGNKNYGWRLYHSATDKYIRKRLMETSDTESVYGNISSTGKQIVIGTNNGAINVFDCICGHLSKSLTLFDENVDTQQVNPSFCFDNNHIISTNNGSLILQAATGDYLQAQQTEVSNYSIDHMHNNQIILMIKNKYINLLKSDTLQMGSSRSSIKGANKMGLNLHGTNIDDLQGISDENAMLFAQSGDYKGFSTEEIRELIVYNEKSHFEKILKIEFSKHYFDSRSTSIIARNSNWTHLESLDLSRNSIQDEDTIKIGKNRTWKNLKELILNSNQIADAAAYALAQNSCWKHLNKLHLSSNKRGILGITALAVNSTWENLEDLDLSQNLIGDDGSFTIGQKTSWKFLKRLNLSSNEIMDKGTEAISKNATWSHLEELNLSCNKI